MADDELARALGQSRLLGCLMMKYRDHEQPRQIPVFEQSGAQLVVVGGEALMLEPRHFVRAAGAGGEQLGELSRVDGCEGQRSDA
jgi:hypothetical protein